MDLRQYFRKLREVQITIADPEALVTSLETSDGGKPGLVTEVSREVAARMIVEGRATLSTDAERKRFLETQEAARNAARAADLAQKLQVTIVTDPEMIRAAVQPAGSTGNASAKK